MTRLLDVDFLEWLDLLPSINGDVRCYEIHRKVNLKWTICRIVTSEI